MYVQSEFIQPVCSIKVCSTRVRSVRVSSAKVSSVSLFSQSLFFKSIQSVSVQSEFIQLVCSVSLFSQSLFNQSVQSKSVQPESISFRVCSARVCSVKGRSAKVCSFRVCSVRVSLAKVCSVSLFSQSLFSQSLLNQSVQSVYSDNKHGVKSTGIPVCSCLFRVSLLFHPVSSVRISICISFSLMFVAAFLSTFWYIVYRNKPQLSPLFSNSSHVALRYWQWVNCKGIRTDTVATGPQCWKCYGCTVRDYSIRCWVGD